MLVHVKKRVFIGNLSPKKFQVTFIVISVLLHRDFKSEQPFVTLLPLHNTAARTEQGYEIIQQTWYEYTIQENMWKGKRAVSTTRGKEVTVALYNMLVLSFLHPALIIS